MLPLVASALQLALPRMPLAVPVLSPVVDDCKLIVVGDAHPTEMGYLDYDEYT